MPHATHVNFIWFRVGTRLPEVKTAPTLVEDMVDLTDYFGDLRQKNSDAFDCTAELQGVAPMRVSFRSLCQTAALLVVHPHTAKDKVPDALCLLVNGLEEPATSRPSRPTWSSRPSFGCRWTSRRSRWSRRRST